ncbi:hypothetical protein EVAR_44602_1 [Eumeta japonica]|uniref:Uncharacterized protein n=1 Tax=Eumeta variegata TaxID=151549 RepID=A0A4C1XD46_EUMVA|nr:hypothetical protein EVAR_44602_1 [Eumeta japonica]
MAKVNLAWQVLIYTMFDISVGKAGCLPEQSLLGFEQRHPGTRTSSCSLSQALVLPGMEEVSISITEYKIDYENESEITMDGIMKELKRVKVGKTAGCDRVSSEMRRARWGIVASLL